MSAIARLLVIDDKRPAVMVMKRLLNVQGYDVSFAFDGLTGLKKAREERPDLIILNESTSETNGYEILKRLRAEDASANIPVLILIDEYRETEASQEQPRPLKNGATDFLIKPVKTQELLKRVLALLKAAGHSL